MKIKIYLLFCSLFLFYQSVAQKSDYSISSAKAAYNQFRLSESRDLYTKISNEAAFSLSERIIALQNLADQDWKFFKDNKQALKKLDKAIRLDRNVSQTYVMAAQIEIEVNDFKAARKSALAAMRVSKTEREIINAEISNASVILYQNKVSAQKGQSVNKEELSEVLKRVKIQLTKQPGQQQLSKLLIEIALLLGDGQELLSGMKSYYFIHDEKRINKVLLPVYQKLSELAVSWKGQSLDSINEKLLIKALAEAKFFREAAFFLQNLSKTRKKELTKDKSLSDLMAYTDFIEGIEKVNNVFYPEVARGRTDYETEYHNAINKEAEQLWRSLGYTDAYNEEFFYKELKKRFGTEGYMGTTVNYYGMLMGHIIHDEQKEIDQYGYKATFRYISVDQLISQDFTSWYGATNVGGWGDDSTIVQVRKAYLNDPFQRLNWVTNSTEKNKFIARINDLKKSDSIKCKEDPYAEPVGLALQLKFNAANQIYDSLKSAGLNGTELSLQFIAENLRLSVEATIFAHEGRHAIDQHYFKKEFDVMPDDERELRAKLSEVIFSSHPKLALTGSIFGSSLDTTTNHGKANFRYRKIIVEWMNNHTGEIQRLDSSKPMLLQVDLLTDKQVRMLSIQSDHLAARKKF